MQNRHEGLSALAGNCKCNAEASGSWFTDLNDICSTLDGKYAMRMANAKYVVILMRYPAQGKVGLYREKPTHEVCFALCSYTGGFL